MILEVVQSKGFGRKTIQSEVNIDDVPEAFSHFLARRHGQQSVVHPHIRVLAAVRCF